MTTALVTGAAGQDGAYLAACLRDQGYRVIGTTTDLADSQDFVSAYLPEVDLHQVDIADRRAMRRLLTHERPDEIYNLASVSSVGQSWSRPMEVARVNGLAVLGLLEVVRQMRDEEGYDPRICQASSAEIFGIPDGLPQSEGSRIHPNNPYGVAKSFAHFTAQYYRDALGVRVSTVILFNHESPLRPATFVTRKITAGVAAIAAGLTDTLELGDLRIRRDWGAAADYVRAMRLVLAADSHDDYCVATGESHELGEFVEMAFAAAGISEFGRHVRSRADLVRPNDIPETLGDPGKIERELGWRRDVDLADLVATMVATDVQRTASGHDIDPGYMV